MRSELQEKLFKNYPKLLRGSSENIQTNLLPFGIETGDGWYYLIDTLCDKIKRHCERTEIDVKVLQIKQKFGGLRFYVSTYDDDIFAMINFAEALSYTICERCSSMKNVKQTTGGWVETLCEECSKQLKGI